ncbi:hypothetical protein N656DRAFT_256571 [Canariomyces notabilis]|uniref:Uncharacterized protein n=1 Tax=Canariomyces notabilis TaxID=2074819 RepID=A0AAN6TLA5_9PEZI|nr:hypothetical protein N656DRAFT_256571 [Canariomyces arenarius]
MAPYMSVERAHRSYGPVDKEALSSQLSKSERRLLRLGLVKSERWRQLPTEGLYQVVILEVLDDGRPYPLKRGGGRAFAVASVLDLGLRMLECSQGREALENLAGKAIRLWRERPAQGHCHAPAKMDLPGAVDEFLRSVRYRFPIVKLDDRNGFYHEEDTEKIFPSWIDELSMLKQSKFNPKAAAVLHLNWQLVDKLYWARLMADVARRHRHEDVLETQTVRFHRLQFHLAAMVTHHLCHLFVNFLREFEGLAGQVTDDDFLRLVKHHDPGAEFEAVFFGGRPKVFIDYKGPREESYPGRSYVIRRASSNDRRVAAVVAQDRIEAYLKGVMLLDFSVPLFTEAEGELPLMEAYRDVKRRYGDSKQESFQWQQGATGARRAAEVGSAGELSLSVPWNIHGAEYQTLKKASFDPAIRLADFQGF